MGERLRFLLTDKNEALAGRLVLVDILDAVQDICRRHQTSETGALALSQVTVALALMGAMIKGDERLALQVVCDGALGQVHADLTAEGRVRAYSRAPQVVGEGPHARSRLLQTLGTKGAVHVLRSLKEDILYRGASALLPAGIERSVERYLKDSEQLGSYLCLDVMVDGDGMPTRAKGLLFQAVGGGDHALFESTVAQLDRSEVRDKLEALPLAQVSMGVFPNLYPGQIHTSEMAFGCPCSKERGANSLAVLGADDLARLLNEQGGAEVTCHFCSEVYSYSSEDMMRLIAELTVQEDSVQS